MSEEVAAKPTVFKFNWLGAGIAVAVSGLLFLLSYLRAGDDFNPVGAVIAMALVILIALIPGYVVFRVTRRNIMAGNIAFSISYLVLIGLLFTAALQVLRQTAPQSQEIMQRQDELIDKASSSLARSIDGEDMNTELLADMDDMISNTEKMTELISGDEKLAMQVLLDFQKELAVLLRKYSETSDRVNLAGGTDPATFSSREEIRKRITLIEEWAEVNEALAEMSANASDNMREKLLQAGISPLGVRTYVEQFEMGHRPDLQARIRGADRLHAKMNKGILELLDTAYGYWHIDDEGYMVFDRQADASKYEDYIVNLENIGFARILAQQELMNRMEAVNP